MPGAPESLQMEAVPFESFFSQDVDVDEKATFNVDADVDTYYDEELEDGEIDMGELVAQHFYLHFCDLEREAEGGDDYDPGDIVFDSGGPGSENPIKGL